MERHSISSQILVFESLIDFTRFVNDTIQVHKSELSTYEAELGQMLRQDVQNNPESEMAREMLSKLASENKQPEKNDDKKDEKQEKGKEREEKEEKGKERKEKRREEKSKKGSTNWKTYNGLQIFTGNATQGKTEVHFEVINELKVFIDKLNRIRETIDQLTNAGVSDALYLVYTKNTIPEKLVLLPQAKQEKDKFEFKADFFTENVELPQQ